ncbi:MAG TPA: hypothetical protein PKW55_04150 [Spirochaetota bacterium]|nr:hypothetical protein [Spirochaetota bacterium]HOM37971.1 hypothetical protein [Spirochaetota bacterium]HPQ48776.1 hypothetical protein [Spirochaetota bacterium]
MKKIFASFFIILIVNLSYAKIILKPGILNLEKLSNSFKELSDLKQSLYKELDIKILLKNSLNTSIIYLEKESLGKTNLSQKILFESTIIHYKQRIYKIEQDEEKFKKLVEKNPAFIELKKKMIKFITTTKIKWGFGFIIQNDQDIILFMDKYPDFNRIIDEEINSTKEGEE